jgi:hypothetical protein
VFVLKDRERSAFGLGWEYARRGKLIDDCPLEPNSLHAQQFRDGFLAFRNDPGNLYHDQDVKPHLMDFKAKLPPLRFVK